MPKPEDDTNPPDDKSFFDAALKDEENTKSGDEEKDDKDEAEKPEAKAKDEPDEGDEPDEPDDKAEGEGEKARRKDYRVPAWRLREEAEARRAAEDRAAKAETERQQREAEIEQERRELQDARRRMASANPAKSEPVPDILENPQGYQDYVRNQVNRQVQIARIDMSFDDAKEAHGTAFDEAFSNLTREIERGNTLLRDQITSAPNPGRALMRWHNERKALSEIGSDFEGYRKKLRDSAFDEALKDPEFRKRALETWKDEASGTAGAREQSRPNTVTRLPPSLNRATGSRSNETEDTAPMGDAELFRHVSR